MHHCVYPPPGRDDNRKTEAAHRRRSSPGGRESRATAGKGTAVALLALVLGGCAEACGTDRKLGRRRSHTPGH